MPRKRPGEQAGRRASTTRRPVCAVYDSGQVRRRTQPQTPVAPVTRFETDDEAITLANQTEYGLSAGILSRSVTRALGIGNRLRTGLLHINDQTVADDVVNPFGGVGASGNGTSIGGPANWEEFTQWQLVTIRGTAQAYPI